MSESTIGAGKSQAGQSKRFGPDDPAVWAMGYLILCLLSPAGFVIGGLAALLGYRRKVRPSRMVAWATFGTVAVLAIAQFAPMTLLRWHVEGWGAALSAMGADRPLAAAARFLKLPEPRLPDISLAGGVLRQLPTGVIVGLWLAAAQIGWATFRRRALNDLEGSKHSRVRPFGIVDWLRARRSIRIISTGGAIHRPHGRRKRDTVALGIGRYGHIVKIDVPRLYRPTLVTGINRSGKTAAALSVLGQAARGGVIVIDFKGDDGPGSPAEFWARWAVANGRKFKHVQTADKNGRAYQPLCPGAPDAKASYDPLRSGNADSKTSMLLGSVDREGDAAAYLRSAREYVMLAYQVASITNSLHGKSGFEVLHNLCDTRALADLLDVKNPATGKGWFADPADAQLRSIKGRVEVINDTIRTDQILRGAVQDTRSLLSSYMNGPALGPWLKPGPTADTNVDLLDAVLEGHVVVFSLPVQDYPDLAKVMGNLVLLDLNNTIASLRAKKAENNNQIAWEPAYLQIEEFGSARSDVVLDVLNKCGDVGIRPLLSSQSMHDLAKDGNDTESKRILDNVGNVFAFQTNDKYGPEVLSEMTAVVTRHLPRQGKEYASGLWGWGLRAANTGKIDTMPVQGQQLLPGDIQQLGVRRRSWAARMLHPGAGKESTVYECIWIATADGKRVTHTHEPGPNEWSERITTVLCGPEEAARRFPGQVHAPTPDHPLVQPAVVDQQPTLNDEPPYAGPPEEGPPEDIHGWDEPAQNSIPTAASAPTAALPPDEGQPPHRKSRKVKTGSPATASTVQPPRPATVTGGASGGSASDLFGADPFGDQSHPVPVEVPSVAAKVRAQRSMMPSRKTTTTVAPDTVPAAPTPPVKKEREPTPPADERLIPASAASDPIPPPPSMGEPPPQPPAPAWRGVRFNRAGRGVGSASSATTPPRVPSE